jgi:hypothetical protein
MINISKDQIEQLVAADRARFMEECLHSIRIEFPEIQDTWPDLRERVSTMIQRLIVMGFDHKGEYAFALNLILRYLLEGRGPMPEIIIEKLNSVWVTSEKKIEALEQLFIFGAKPTTRTYSTMEKS